MRLLENNGVQTWYSKLSIKSASQWEKEILRGMESCDWFVLIVSPRAATSEWIKDELNWAFYHRPTRIVPVIMEQSNLWEFHIGHHWPGVPEPKRSAEDFVPRKRRYENRTSCDRIEGVSTRKGFELSKRFYADLGFALEWTSPDNSLACFGIGSARFLLQTVGATFRPDYFMMHLLVPDVQRWWDHTGSDEPFF